MSPIKHGMVRGRGNVVKAARLENREDGHSKFYEIALEEMENGTYVIRTFWGKIGVSSPGSQVKDAPTSIVDAMVVFHDWLHAKMERGYKDTGSEPSFAK